MHILQSYLHACMCAHTHTHTHTLSHTVTLLKHTHIQNGMFSACKRDRDWERTHTVLVVEFVPQSILINFQEKLKAVFLKTKIVSILLIYIIYTLRIIRWEWLLCTYYIFDNKVPVWHTSKCTIFSLTKAYTMFLHRDRQLSWWCYVFERDTQFSYSKISNFSDDLKFLNQWRQFYTRIEKLPDDFMPWPRHAIFIGWIFCNFRVPIDAACLLRNNKNLKITKILLTQKFCYGHDIQQHS